ncbi:LADA_0D10770g1_1 [Lachancea dasiensis]|uniref:LADA_0D10770g1_1 n=1 Tax=Lachancea dasiensis TaxID=1072105 RepID=A0A1G4J7P9_9SACH|nr:LADA_0D10770g1_1 [Lachancea dasiensis]
MSTYSGFRNSVASPSNLKGLVSTNEGVLKVWVRLEASSSSPNMTGQATAIEYVKTDTIDDLKDRIFAKFSSTRWAMENDNFGIAIGCLCNCGMGSKPLGDQQPIKDTARLELTRDQLLHPMPAKSIPMDIDHGAKSWQASRECSPKSSNVDSPLPPRARNTVGCTSSSTPMAPLRAINKESHLTEPCSFSPVRLGVSRRFSCNLNSGPILIEPSQDDLPRPQVHQSLLSPDEMVIDVCKVLFGGTSTQKAAEALIVFSHTDDIAVFNDVDDQLDDPIDQQVEEPIPFMEELADYKLIVDEEQLRKLSLTNDEENAEHKQAILLLPRGFEGDVNLPSPNVTSPTLTTSSNVPSLLPTSVPPHSALVEGEIGVVLSRDPIVQREASPFHLAMEPVTTEAITREKVFPKLNVLVVEDNMINQTILLSFLRKHKISYKAAKNGVEAVEKWKEGGIHLILMDLGLPLLSGIEAAKEIRLLEKQNGASPHALESGRVVVDGLQRDIPIEPFSIRRRKAPVIIVALTASNSVTDKAEAILAGCNDYLTKPVNLDWLTRKITEWGCMQALIDFNEWKEGHEKLLAEKDGTSAQVSGNSPLSVQRAAAPQVPSKLSDQFTV